MWKLNKTIKDRLTYDANNNFARRSSDFGLTKKTRNSDSLTSEFHSGCKNIPCTPWTGTFIFIRPGTIVSVESRTPYCRRPRPASASSPWPKKSKSEIFHENQFLTITKQKLKQKTILFIFDIFRTGIDPCFENSFFTNSNIFLIYLLYFSQISHKK